MPARRCEIPISQPRLEDFHPAERGKGFPRGWVREGILAPAALAPPALAPAGSVPHFLEYRTRSSDWVSAARSPLRAKAGKLHLGGDESEGRPLIRFDDALEDGDRLVAAAVQ